MSSFGMRETGVSTQTIELISLCYLIITMSANRIMNNVECLITARYPAHEVSKWLDHSEEHSTDIDNLHGADGDFHHGFNSGVLAASRMFKDHADVSEVQSDSVSVLLQQQQCIHTQELAYIDINS